MRITRRLAVSAAAMSLVALGATACGGGGGSSSIGNGNSGKPAGHEVKGGTVSIGWQATPNFIFPLAPATNTDGFNANLTGLMWPNLVYAGDGGQSIVNPNESLYSSLTYSNGDRTITMVLKPWKWSDGQPITSRDFLFTYNLLKPKADYNNWIDYISGLFPADVSSVTTPNVHTAVINLTRSYNPEFYTDDVLSEVPLMPQHAWDKESAAGPVGNYDETASGAQAVYAFLQKQGGQMSSFTTNPLWKVVDGPFKLSLFDASSGLYDYVPNTAYSGPDKPVLAKVVNEPYTTDTAMLEALRAGTLDIGNLPQNDLGQSGVLKSGGYSLANQYVPGVAEILPNEYNTKTGPLVQQLYIRQAMEYLINRKQIVSKVFAGYADPGNGPVPVVMSSWISSAEKGDGAYPYSPSKAIALLKAHGWSVKAGGASTCQSPGTGASDCGAGITKGEPLSFTLVYTSGSSTGAEMEAAIQSSEEQAGVDYTLKSEPFNTISGEVGTCTASSHPSSTCSWQLVDYGYDPYELDPAGAGFFNTGGVNNLGGYSNPQMDSLINATEYGSSAQAFDTYENYATQQLPWLWVPDPSFIQVYKSNLAGYAPLNPFSGGLNPQDWYFTSGK
jgi:peptide/nickel transport system substrate-binding protein